MKMIRHLLGSLLVGCLTSSAHAQIINSLDIHGKMLPGKDPYSTRFSVVLDSSQLSDSDLDKTDHPLHPIKAKIDALLSRYGTIETGEESGFGRRAYQVDLDLIRKDGNVVEGNIALASVLGLRSAFLPYQQNLYSKTLDGGVPYIELRGKYAEEINHFFLCVVLDYKSHVEGSLSLTNKLTRLLQENCSRRWSQEELNASFQTLRSEVRLSTAEEHVDFKSERNNFSPFGLEEDLFECRNMTTTGLSEMVKLGWFASADPLQAIEDCCAFVYGLFFHLDQDIPKIFDPRVLRESISPYYRSLLQSIIEKSGKLVVKEKMPWKPN